MVRAPGGDKQTGLKKGPWTPEEDIILVTFIQQHGPGNWRAVTTNTGLRRCSKSCRLRWTNYLRPGIKRGNFTEQEEKMIIHLQALLGNRWAAIASYLPQRTDNDIKNYWNTHLNKKLDKTFHDQSESKDGLMSSSSSSPSSSSSGNSSSNLSRGQWERRLQTDIHTAKQALFKALSPDPLMTNPSFSVGGSVESQVKPATAAYASSTENIAKLLKGWMKNSPPKKAASAATPENCVKEETNEKNEKEEMCVGCEPMVDVDINYSKSEVCEAEPDMGCCQKQLSVFETWLFEDSAPQLEDMLSDEVANFF